MKVKLLITAAVMTAASMATQNVFAGQGLSFGTALMVSASPEGETEDVIVADETTDYTSYVRNASCTNDDRGSWTRNSLSGNSAGYVVDNSALNSDVYTGKGIEFWRNPNADGALHNQDLLWQVVKNLPAGVYNVTAYAAGTDQGANPQINNVDLFLFAGDKQTQVTSMTWAEYTIEEVEVGNDGLLKVGLHGGAENWNNWVQIANVRLFYVNNESSLNLVITKAQAINAIYNDEELASAISVSSIGNGKTATEYKTAISALNQAIETTLTQKASSDIPYTISAFSNDFSGVEPNGWMEVSGNCRSFAYTNSNKAAERWHSAFNIKQELSGLPNGKYKVSVQAISQDTQDFQIYAKGDGDVDEISKVVTDMAQSEGDGTDFQKTVNYMISHPTEKLHEIEMTVTNGSLYVGMSAGASNWMVINDFKLEYLGFGQAVVDAIADAEQYLVDNKELLPTPVYNNVSNAKDELSSNGTTEYITKLNDAIATANSVKVPYADFNELKAFAQSMLESLIVVETENKTVFTNTLEEQISAVDEAENSETITNALAALKDACVIFAGQASPASGEQFDITRLFLVNPEVSAFASWGSVEGWYGDMNGLTDEGIRCQHNNAQMGETSSDAFFEHYAGVPLATGWTIYQKATLSAGNYKMSVAAFAGPVNNIAGTGDAVAALYAGEQRGDKVNSTTLAYGSVYFTLAEGSEVNLGMKFEDGNLANWAGLNDMHLYKIGSAVDMTLSETGTYAVTEDTYANVTLNRTLKADDKWNTFCVPFDMPTDEFSAVKKLTAASTEGETTSLTFEDATSIEAGVPYIVKVDAEKTSLTVDGVVVKAAAPEALTVTDAQGNTISMIGNYETKTIADGEFFISDNVFYVADANVNVKGFRAYITLATTEETPSAVNRMLINMDGETTAIEDVLGESAAEADKLVDVYTLSGVKVKNAVKKADALNGLVKGIYIVDGKKIVK